MGRLDLFSFLFSDPIFLYRQYPKAMATKQIVTVVANNTEFRVGWTDVGVVFIKSSGLVDQATVELWTRKDFSMWKFV